MTRKNSSDSSTADSSASTSQASQHQLPGSKWLRALAAAGITLAATLTLLIGAFFYMVNTEQGTRFAWRAAVILSGGHLSGTLVGGKLNSGLRLTNVKWHTKESDIRFDRLHGQWTLSAKPWRLVVEFLDMRTIDLRFTAQKKSSKATLPNNLTLPLGVEIRDVRIRQIFLHEGTSTTELKYLLLQARSDGRHHEVTLERMDPSFGAGRGYPQRDGAKPFPFGAAHIFVKLDGFKPFPLSGRISFSTQTLKPQTPTEEALIDTRLSGTLSSLMVDLTASGKKLTGYAHIEALPFSPVALKVATLKIEHLNPRAFSATAPLADLSLHAQLQPVPNQTPKRTPSASAATQSDELIVAGPLSIINRKPGALDAQLLPLLDVQANIRLSEQKQSFDGLQIRLLKNLTLTGNGNFTNGRGQINLHADKLNLNAFNKNLRQTQLSGPITISLAHKLQQAELKLNDPRLALHTETTVNAEAKQTSFNSMVRINAGRATLAGTLKKDKAESYQLEMTLARLTPLSLLNPSLLRQMARASQRQQLPSANLSGTFTAEGKLAKPSVKATYALHDSEYGGLPLTGAGTLQFTKKHLLPSDAQLSIAGNQIAVHGSFGRAEDRLVFKIDAPQIARLGFGLAGSLQAGGDISGTLIHPRVSANYQARSLAFGKHRLTSAQGKAELSDGANGALNLTMRANGLATSGISLTELNLNLTGTRAKHALTANTTGQIHNMPLALTMAARGGLTDQGEQTRWTGLLTQFANRGVPSIQLNAPVAISAAQQQLTIDTARLKVEQAVLNLRKLVYDHGHIQSTGKLTGVDLNQLLQVSQLAPELTAIKTDLVFDSDWDFAINSNASGYLQFKRRAGDMTFSKSRGAPLALGITQLDTRVDFTQGQRANLTAHANAARLGAFETALQLPLTFTEGQLNLADTLGEHTPLAGNLSATIPSLKNTGSLLGPQFILEGQAGLNLSVAGQIGQPIFSGMLRGDNLALSLLNEGVTLKEGVLRIALSDNTITLKQVEFHGASGVLTASGGIQLDQTNPAISAQIEAKKLALFATPERQLSLSGKATIANTGARNKLEIDGAFTVDQALLDLPATHAPQLSDDVKIIHPNDEAPAPRKAIAREAKPVGKFLPTANISIDLGNDFRFRGVGADLDLRGKFTVISVPEEPLHATGDVKVLPGSTYETFGRKLKIEKGYFTFNGPIDNPGINILAMRRNQAVEAGVAVTGTVRSPQARLYSEPNTTDEDKLSWLLFGHGVNSGTNLGQQNTMNAAIALLGNTGGKKIAKTIGFDEFSIGQSEAGLTDTQVVNVAKAINERLILGYEQGLTTSANLFKLTWQISRSWSLAGHTGTLNGLDLIFQRRFNRLFKHSKKSKKLEADKTNNE